MNRTGQRRGCALHDGFGGPALDQEHLLFEQAAGDDRASPRQDAGIGLPRHPHALRSRVLVEPFHVCEPNRLEFVEADANGVGLASGAPNRTESAGGHLTADTARDEGRRHNESICSHQRAVNRRPDSHCCRTMRP
jgi:hypothetical protein